MTKIREGYKETEIGIIPDNWEVDLLDNVARRLTGHTPDKKNKLYWNGDIPWVSLKDTFRLDKRYVFETTDYTTIDGIENSSAVLLPEGSVIISRDATVGKVGITSTEMATSQHFINYICSENLNNEYLYYVLLHRKDEFIRIAIGSTIKTIGMPFFRSLKVILPPLTEQQRIAEILSTTDDHIKKLDKIIEDYKLLKKGMMKKLLTEGISHTEFKETEFGRIPNEWEIVKLRELAEICYGKNQKDVVDDNGLYKIFGTGGLMGYANSYLYDKPSVLIGRKGTINKPMYVDEPFWTVDTLFYTKISSDIDGKWLYYYLNMIDLSKYNEATGVPSLNTSTLNEILIKKPPREEQERISSLISQFDIYINKLEKENCDFIMLKKSLMEKLLTGKVRVI